VFRLHPEAGTGGRASARSHLHVVTDRAPARDQAPDAPGEAGRSTERDLLDAWREAHWTLRVRMRDVARDGGDEDIEALYDRARRADNRLTEFYQARAEHLARRLRTVLVSSGEAASAPRDAEAEPVDGEEQALLRHFRALADEDRASLLRLAARLGVQRATAP
jgi:hypothetical protein